ncbi:MAG: hypothetical protein V7607_5425 [Solirubrobacteraceae bacterium]
MHADAAMFRAGVLWLDVMRRWPNVDADTVCAAAAAAAAVTPYLDKWDERESQELPLDEGYGAWAHTHGTYDDPLAVIEGPVVKGLFRGVEGMVLDAGCGSGRHAAHLVAAGMDVVGVDACREMLAAARMRVPRATFRPGRLEELPLPEQSVDHAVCALAMDDVPHVAPVVKEMARVVRDGGHVVITASHPATVEIGGHTVVPRGRDAWGFMRRHAHWHEEYLSAFEESGLEVIACMDLKFTARAVGALELLERATPTTLGGAAITLIGWPAVLVWHLGRLPREMGPCYGDSGSPPLSTV